MGHKQKTVNATGWSAVVKRWRRNNRRRLNTLLTGLLGTTEPRRRPLADDTRRILVVRLNKRLGNILFLTPMLRTLAATLPTARIDVVIQDARQKTLLESLPGVGRVWVQRKTVSSLIGLIRRLRAQHYDLAIDPSGNSTSNRIAMALSGARQRMGFASNSQWLRLSHAVSRTHSRHQAEKAVELLTASVSGTDFECFDTLAVFPGERAQRLAREHWPAVLTHTHTPVIGFFTQATGGKQLPRAWWVNWLATTAALNPKARFLQICAPGQIDQALPEATPLAIEQLDVLAALMTRLDVFVAADSGPMHLAAAAGVPVLGLFRITDPAAYAPLGRACISMAGPDFSADDAARAVTRLLAAEKQMGVA